MFGGDRILRLAAIAAALAITGCAEAPKPVQLPPGPLSYKHRDLGQGQHVLLLTAAPARHESEMQVVQRIRATTGELASGICPGGYQVIHEPQFEGVWLKNFERRTESYVFACL